MHWLDHMSDALAAMGVRLFAFMLVLLVMAALELAAPRRPRRVPRARRWATNLSLVVLGSLLVRVLAAVAQPLTAIGAAVAAEHAGLGLLNTATAKAWLAGTAAIVLTVLALDLAVWGQHWASHRLPVLWRLHRVHHADIDVDTTTGVRFHPVEIALSMLYKSAVVMALGAPAAAVLLFEVLLNATSLFNHANVRLPHRLDRLLRLMLVTPDMHRIHHSVEAREHDSNYGFCFSLWDRLLGTWTAMPRLGHAAMTTGLAEYQSDAPTRLGWCLRLPFGARYWRSAH